LGLSIGIAGLILTLLYWNDEQSYDDGTWEGSCLSGFSNWLIIPTGEHPISC
jgi:hypothetical protein